MKYISVWFFLLFFSLHVIIFFSFLFLWLISSFTPLWSEKMLEIISILLNLFRLVFCPSMWFILEIIPCALKNNVYSGFFGCNVLKISIKSNCSIVSFRISVSLLIFYVDDLSIDVSGVFKSHTIIVLLSISPFRSINFALYI